MVRRIVLAALAAISLGGAALAACPTTVPANTSDAILANQQRVLCLQQAIDQDAQQRRLELELGANQNAIVNLQMRQRFDALPQIIIPSQFSRPQPFGAN
ncbi:MAG: hypothetical protein JWP99_603 [Devosia sp.]|nr:hypothetical protein [Devosia sp.]